MQKIVNHFVDTPISEFTFSLVSSNFNYRIIFQYFGILLKTQ